MKIDKPSYSNLEKETVHLETELNQLKQFYNQAPFALLSLNGDGSVAEANTQMLKLLGLKRKNFISKWFGSFLHPEDIDKFSDHFPFTSKEKSHQYQFRIKTSNLMYQYIILDYCSGDTAVKSELCFFYIVRELTTAKENKVLLHENTTRQYLEAARIILLALDENATVVYINPKGCETIGYEANEIIGKNWIETYLPKEYVEQTSIVFKQMISGKTKQVEYFENPIVRKGGEQRLIAWHNSILLDKNNRICGCFSSGEDITIARNDKNAATIVGNYEWDLRTLNGKFSTEARQILGINDPAYIFTFGQWLETVFEADREIVNTTIDNAIKDQKSYHLDFRIYRKNDRVIRWINENGTILRNSNGEAIAAIGTIQDVTERKNSESLIDTFFEQPINLHLIVDFDWKILKINRGWENALGYKKEELVGTSFFSLVHPDDTEITRNEIKKFDQGKSLFHFESRCLRKNGSCRLFVWSAIAIHEKQNIHAIAHDITEHKETEQKIIESERRLNQAQEVAQIGSWEYDIESDEISWSKQMYRIVGRDLKKWSPSLEKHKTFLRENDWNRFSKVTHEAVQKGIPYDEDFEIVLPSGEIRYVHSIGKPVVNGKSETERIIGTTQDITELRKSELALNESQRWLRTLMSNLPGAAYRRQNDNNWTMNFISDGAYDLLGYKAYEITNQSGVVYAEIIHPDYKKSIWDKVQKAVENNSTYNFTYKVITKQGIEKWVWEQGQPLIDQNQILLEGFITDITERVKAEAALKESEARFQFAMDSNTDGLWDWNLSTNEIYLSPGWKRIIGYQDDELANTVEVWEQYTYDDDVKKIWKTLDEYVSLKRPKFEIEIRMRHKKGYWVDILSRAEALFDQNNKPNRVIGTHIDISERKKMENKIRDNERRLNEIMKATTEGMWDWNLINDNVFFDSRYFEHIGYKTNAFPHRLEEFLKRVHPDDVERVKQHSENYISGKTSKYKIEFRIKHKNGNWLWILGRGIIVERNLNGEPTRLIGTHYNITNKKTAEQALLEHKEILALKNCIAENFVKLNNEALFSSVLKLILKRFESEFGYFGYIDVNGNLVCPSMTYSIWEKCNPENQPTVFPKDNWSGIWGESLIKKKTIIKNERNTITQEHIEIQNAIACAILNQDEVIGQITLANRNNPYTIEEQKLLEEICGYISPLLKSIITEMNFKDDLIRSKERAEESDRLKTEFINNMSHEIRTPMNGVLGFSRLLLKTDLSEEKRTQYIKIIQNSGDQLLRVIDDILEISCLETKQVKVHEAPLCLNDFLLELFTTFDVKAKENETPLYLKKGLNDKQSTITTDQSKLDKVLCNLLENAIKFTNTGYIELGYQLIEDKLQIYVKDTGVGIRANKFETIFKRFSQEEKELSKHVGGLGLGLSIAKENIELLGGKITLESEKGKGSTFYLLLPYKPVYSQPILHSNKQEKIMNDQHSILIVEDEEINFLFLEALISDEISIDCNILYARNGEEAIEIVRTNHNIDMVFMDLKMPIINGFEATRRIKSIRPNLPIFAQTAYTSMEDREKAVQAGCDAFISKPINENELGRIISKHLVH